MDPIAELLAAAGTKASPSTTAADEGGTAAAGAVAEGAPATGAPPLVLVLDHTGQVEPAQAGQEVPGADVWLITSSAATSSSSAATSSSGADHVTSEVVERPALLREWLLRSRPPQVVLEIGTHQRGVEWFDAVWMHLADRGWYLTRRTAQPGPAVLERLRGLRQRTARATQGPRPERELARAIGTIDRGEVVLAIERRGPHLVAVRDDVCDEILDARLGPGWGSRLETRPARQHTALARHHVNVEGVGMAHPRTFDVPERRLRELGGVICGPRQLALLGDVVLPLSYHHPAARRLRGKETHDLGSEVTLLRKPLRKPAALPGTYYHLASEFPLHFGHVLTEDLGRLWGWDAAKQRHPELKLLVGAPDGPPPEFFLALLAAYGIDRDDVVPIAKPVRVERLVGATPQFHNNRYVDPDITQTWDRVRAGLGVSSGEGGTRRIFVGRPETGPRHCHQAADVQAYFEAAGFEIVRPERFSITDQVQMFCESQVVAGYAGSGLFTSMFAPHLQHRIVIGSDAYTASNEWLISAVRGGGYHHLWGRSDVAQPARGWTSEAFHSDFSLDLDRDLRWLDQVLAHVDSPDRPVSSGNRSLPARVRNRLRRLRSRRRSERAARAAAPKR